MEEKEEPRIVESGPIGIKVDLKKALVDFSKGVLLAKLRQAAEAANKESNKED